MDYRNRYYMLLYKVEIVAHFPNFACVQMEDQRSEISQHCPQNPYNFYSIIRRA